MTTQIKQSELGWDSEVKVGHFNLVKATNCEGPASPISPIHIFKSHAMMVKNREK